MTHRRNLAYFTYKGVRSYLEILQSFPALCWKPSFSLPYQWSQAELDRLCIFIDYRGKTPTKVDCGVRLITAKNVRDGFIKQDPEEFIEEDTYRNWMTRGFPKQGDVLFTTEAPMGKAAVVDLQERFALAQRIINLQPLSYLNGHFLMWLILSPWFQGELQEYATGMTATGIKASKLKQMQIPLPPLAEQKRIVAKVDELMALCDRYEVLKCDRNTLRTKMRASAIDALMNAETDESLNTAWEFVQDNWECLSQQPDDMRVLKTLILQLAVRGVLGTQDINDPPASQLIEVINRERKKQQNRKKNSLEPLPELQQLQRLPDSWMWCRVGKVVDVCLGGTPSRQEPRFWNGSIPWVSSGEVANCSIKDTRERITHQGLASSNAKLYPVGTVLIAIIGQGKTRGQSAILEIEACTNQNIVGLVFDGQHISSEYVFKWALSIYESARSGGHGGAQPALNCKKVKNLLFPLPPLAEQKRIVAKVEQLMALCTNIEAHLLEIQEKVTALAAAVVGQLEV